MMTNMEENICYVGKLHMPYTECVNFKEKEAMHITAIINGARISDYVGFMGYANMFFDEEDNKRWNPKFDVLGSFTRNKSNALMYVLRNCEYDRLFIYKTNTKESGFYGIVLYNTENGKSSNVFNIELDYSRLMITINRIIDHKKIK